MKKAVHEITKTVLILIAGGIIGFALLFLVYMLPTEPMIRNTRASIDIFKIEGASSQTVHGYKATTLDNYTDAWMLRNACYDGDESVLQKCLHVYFYGYIDGETTDSCERLIAWIEGKEGYVRENYARYWHGYLTVLKPLLCFFDYGDIREILKFAGLAMLVYLCVLLERAHMTRIIPALIAAMACMEFHTVGMSMQYTWVFFITMFFSIIIIKKRTPLILSSFTFLVIGMLTSYFDFLTYPPFTLGIPLLFWTLCMKESESHIFLPAMAFKNSVYWAIGYLGMWIQKWILCTIFTEENIIANAVHSILIRSGTNVAGNRISYWDTVRNNIIVLAKYPYVLAFITAVILLLFLCKKANGNKFSKNAFITYIFIAALPFFWYAISMNHAYIHSFMTYKSLSITVFAALCALDEITNGHGPFFPTKI